MSIWNKKHVRALIFQALVLIAVAAIGFYLLNNTLNNLKARGIATGFGFLSSEAGFGIIQHLIDYNESSSFGRVFIVGLLNTLLVAVLGIVFATVLGFVIGISRLSGNWLISRLAATYIEIFRNIPLLLQIFFWYFAVLRTLPSPRRSLSLWDSIFLNIRGLYLPSPVFEEGFWLVLVALAIAGATFAFYLRILKKRKITEEHLFQNPLLKYLPLALLILIPLLVFVISGSSVSLENPRLKGFNFVGGIVIIPELAALLIALTIYTAAFIAEIVRAGIQAVGLGQTEAAYALGLRPGITLRLVVIPQAMRVIIPPLTSQYLNLTKNSSLATAIGYPDLVSVFAGTTLNQTGQAVEVIAITMAVYLTISLTISAFMNWYNLRSSI